MGKPSAALPHFQYFWVNVMVLAAKSFTCDTNMYYEETPGAFFDALGGLTPSQYCRWLWRRNSNENGRHLYVPVGQTKRQRKVISSLSSFYLQTNTDEDLYFTPNTFFDWRRKALLSGLCANYVEIDTSIERMLTASESQQVLDEVLQQVAASGTPSPNAIVESGSGGLHLYWFYEMIDAFPAQKLAWEAISKKLTDRFTGGDLWHVDTGASHDMTRFLRLPGSKHSASGKRVKIWLSEQQYSFKSLASKLDVVYSPTVMESIRVSASVVPNETPLPRSTEPENSTPARHSIANWWSRIYWHLSSFIRSSKRIKSGQRDSVAFIAFVALRRITSINKAWELIRELNDKHIGLTPSELEQYLSSAVKTIYRYKKSTLVKYFAGAGIPIPDFLLGETKRWNVSLGLTVDEIKKRQIESGINSARKRSERNRIAIFNAIQTLLSRGTSVISSLSVASMAGCSRRTAQRVLASFGTIVYPPPAGGVSFG
ncbi:hypothetical protein RSG05_002420 [Yersinia enterocolitica]|nr:hypothetical protein [Yersinia enterocolitica]